MKWFTAHAAFWYPEQGMNYEYCKFKNERFWDVSVAC